MGFFDDAIGGFFSGGGGGLIGGILGGLLGGGQSSAMKPTPAPAAGGMGKGTTVRKNQGTNVNFPISGPIPPPSIMGAFAPTGVGSGSGQQAPPPPIGGLSDGFGLNPDGSDIDALVAGSGQTSRYGQTQQQQQQTQSGSSFGNMDFSGLFGSGTTATGMTPDAVNAYGEPYYGWGAQTGDWGANATIPFDGSQYAGQSGLAEGVGEQLGQMGGNEGGSMSSMPLAYVLAAIMGQHELSNRTNRETPVSGVEGKGHQTGDVFTGDFFTEPWQSWTYDQLGMKTPSPGEKTDASINAIRDGESGWDNLLRSAPGTAAQWFDPGGSVGFDILDEKGGKFGGLVSKQFMPHQWIARLFD